MASEWTVDTLKEHWEVTRQDDQRALSTALVATEKRFDSINEFRGTLSDQQRLFIPRAEADSEFRALRERLDGLTDRMNLAAGKGAGLKDGWAYLIAAVGLVGMIVSLILNLKK